MQWLILILVVPYFILLLRIYFNLRKIKPFEPGSEPTGPGIAVTVITACRNEAGSVGNLIDRLLHQDYPSDLTEFIIVDDNSTDDTFSIVSGFSEVKNLKLLRNAGKGKKAAIKTGVDASTGQLIATTDADCLMGPGWLSAIESFYYAFRPDLIICPVALESGPGIAGKFQELEFLSLQGVTAGTAAGRNSTMCNGANLAFTKDTWLRNMKNLRFEIPSGDDIFLLHSLKAEKGSKIMWLESTDALVNTPPAKSISDFLRQRKRWISKGGSYSDKFTITLSIVTFVTILAELSALAAAFFISEFIWVFAAIIAIKSVPDFLILSNTTGRYSKRSLMKWFFPSQLVYPFYVITVVFFTGRQVK